MAIEILDDDPLLSEQDAAEAIGRTTRTLRRWRALRDGPPTILIGRERYYRRSALREWLLNKEGVR